jgi:hypothetical protein
MKTLRYLTGLLGVLVLAAGLCAKDFEGKIRFKMTVQDEPAKKSIKMTGQDEPAKRSTGNAPAFMDYYLKGGLMRADLDAGNGQIFGSIIDPAKREMTILMGAQKMYMVKAMPEPQKTDGVAAPSKDAEFVRTGETETILGYRCEKILVKNKQGEAEIWAAEGFGTFHGMGGGNPMGRSAPKSAWEAALAEHGYFPLRVVNRDKNGKEIKRLEAVSVEPQSLSASIFAPPSDYRKFEMPSIPGLGGFGRGAD